MPDPNLVGITCWGCGGEGYIDGLCTCGESCCCCLDPDPPVCQDCHGTGVLMVSPECAAREENGE